jgi:hypothetical protein
MAEQVTRKVIPYVARPWFRSYHERTQDKAVLVVTRRGGKTYATIKDQEKDIMLEQLPGPKGAYVAPLLQQAKKITWTYYMETIRELASMGARALESDHTLIYPNGGTIELFGADRAAGEKMRGQYFDNIIIDEPEDIANFDEFLKAVVIPCLSDRRGKLTVIGTVKASGVLHSLVTRALKDTDWFCQIIPASKTRAFTKEELAEFRAQMGDAYYEREYECSFDVEGDKQFISRRDVLTAAGRTPVAGDDIVIACDPARYGGDRTAIVVRDTRCIHAIVVRQGIDLMATADLIAHTARRFPPMAISIDATGIGSGIVDYLRRAHYKVNEVHGSERASDDLAYFNRRCEMWARMREWIRHPDTSLQVPAYADELLLDLTGLEYVYDIKNRLRLESKDELKKRGLPSPDLADALALTFAVELAPKMVREQQSQLQIAWASEEYSPFSDI